MAKNHARGAHIALCLTAVWSLLLAGVADAAPQEAQESEPSAASPLVRPKPAKAQKPMSLKQRREQVAEDKDKGRLLATPADEGAEKYHSSSGSAKSSSAGPGYFQQEMFHVDMFDANGKLLAYSHQSPDPRSELRGFIPKPGDELTIKGEVYYNNDNDGGSEEEEEEGPQDVSVRLNVNCNGSLAFWSSEPITLSGVPSHIHGPAWVHLGTDPPPARLPGAPVSFTYKYDENLCHEGAAKSGHTSPTPFLMSITGPLADGTWPNHAWHMGGSVRGFGLSGVPANQTYGAECDGNSASAAHCQEYRGVGVNTSTGAFAQSATDVSIPGVLPLGLTRSYSSNNSSQGSLGAGWSASWDTHLKVEESGDVTFHSEDGSEYPYKKSPDGIFKSPATARSTLQKTSNGYELKTKTGNRLQFDEGGKIVKLQNPQGNELSYGYKDGVLESVSTPEGRKANFAFDGGRVSSIALADGRKVSYEYADGKLANVIAPGGHKVNYTYDANGRLANVTDPRNNPAVRNIYDSKGRVSEQNSSVEGKLTFAYKDGETDVTKVDGSVWTDVYQANVLLAQYDPFGNRTSYGYSFMLDPVVTTDALGNTFTLEVDKYGRIKEENSPISSRNWTYNTEGGVAWHTNGNEKSTIYGYDSSRRLTSARNALRNSETYSYTAIGQLASLTDSLGKITRYGHDEAGNQTSITYPNGARSTQGFDAAGRVTSVTDPRGNAEGADPAKFTTEYTYDAAGRLDRSTDAKGHTTDRDYDAAGNLTLLKDAAGNTTTYTYDAANRLKDTTDAAKNVSSLSYNSMGYVSSSTDATGAKTTYTYDKAGRVLTMTTPRGNVAGADPAKYTWTYGYDKVGNQTSVTDPLGRTTITEYDAEYRPVKVTNPLGKFRTTKYDGESNVVEVVDELGKPTAYTYDANSQLTAVKNPTGEVTTYGYDAAGQRTSQTTPLGGKTTYSYDDNGRLAATVEPRGNVAGADPEQYTHRISYDQAGNRIEEKDPLGNTSKLFYDALNNVVESTDPLGKSTFYTYNTLNRLSKVTASDNGATSYQYDALGNLKSRTDANEHTTVYGYDNAGRIAQVADPLERARAYEYDAEGNLIKTTNARGQTISNTFDARSLLIKSSASDGTAAASYTYDALGRPTKITDGSGSRALAYDDASRLTSVIPSVGGGVFRYTYDDSGRITKRSTPAQQQPLPWDGAVQTLTGDLNGDGTTDVVRTDSKSGLRAYLGSPGSTFTAGGSLTGTSSGFSQAVLVEYTGDSKLDLLAVDKSTGHLLRYNGDGKGGFAAPVDMGAGWGVMTLTTGDFNGDSKQDFFATSSSANTMYFYPGKGDGTFGARTEIGPGWSAYRLTAVDYNKDGKLDVLAIKPSDNHLYFYPGLGNGTLGGRTDLGSGWAAMFLTPGDFNGDSQQDFLTHNTTTKQVRFYPGTGTGTFGTYVAQEDWTPYGPPLAGKFDSGTTLDAVAPDASGHLLTWDGDGNGKLTQRSTATTLTSMQAAYSYDADGRTTTQTVNGTTFAYGYDPAGNLTSTTLPLANGHTENRSYDRAGRLTTIGSTKAGATLANWQLNLNAAGQPTRVDTERTGQAVSSRYYSYDSTGRLLSECTSATKAETCPKPENDIAYTYDKIGNRLTETTAGTSTQYTYDAADQLSSTTSGTASRTFGYDADGNQTASGPNTFTYDVANRLTAAKTGTNTYTFGYDVDGNRTSASKNGSRQRTTYWDINNPLPQIAAETNGNGSLTGGYTYNPLGQIQSMNRAADTFYYHHDGLGSVTDLTNAQGAQQYRYNYDAFGELTTDKVDSDAPANPFTYTGQYKEPTTDELGYYLRARNYAPDQGRFTSRDPVTRSNNEPYVADYAYADNRPTSLTDPSGRCPLCISAGIGAALGTVVEGGIYTYQHRNDGQFSWGGLAKASGKGALVGGLAGALMPGAGNAAARGFGLTGARGIATSTAVNAGIGAGFSWGVNQANCRPTDPWDLILGAAGGGSSSLTGPAFSWMHGLFAPRVTVSAHTGINANAFRALRPGEGPSASLVRPGANGNVPPWSHVMGAENSPWISLTSDPRVMYNIYGEASGRAGNGAQGYIAVDLSRVTSETVDAAARLEVPDHIRALGLDLGETAFRDKEILVKFSLQGDAVVKYWPAGTSLEQIMRDLGRAL